MSEPSSPADNPGPGAGRGNWPVLVQVTFPAGDYSHAIGCWRDAQEWILDCGLAYATDLAGTLYHPAHPQSPVGEKLVPAPLLGLDGWETTVDLWCDDQAALARLLAIPLPEGAALLDENGRPFGRR